MHRRIEEGSVNSAEQAVLGGLFLRGDAWDEVASVLSSGDFLLESHRLIFRAMNRLVSDSKPIDAITVAEELDEESSLHLAGGLQYLTSLAKDTPSASNIAAYAGYVKEASLRNRAKEILIDGVDAIDISENAIDTVVSRLMELTASRSQIDASISESHDKAFEKIDAAMNNDTFNGIRTGLIDLDTALGGGYYAGDFTVIGARPGMGKTAMVLDAVMAAGNDKIPVGLISTEQPQHQIVERMLCKITGVPVTAMRSGKLDQEQFAKLVKASDITRRMPIRISDAASPTIGDISRLARSWVRKYGIKALLVDYIQRVDGNDPRIDKQQRTAEVAKGLKTIGRELDISVVALSQVNREVDNRTNKRPFLSDFSWSAAIEQEADAAITIYRDEVYRPETQKKGEAEIAVVKSRHGEVGVVTATWLGRNIRFADMARTGPPGAAPKREWVD